MRWRRPGRVGLFRLAAIALLLTTAAAVIYIREPASCPPSALPPTGPSASAGSAPLAGSPASASPDPGRPRAVPRGSVGVPVRLAEPAALGVLHPGDRVDLLAAAADGDAAKVASNALVLGVGSADDPGAGLYLALTTDEARRTAAVPGEVRFSVLVRPPP